ncbi:sugar ABC transporter permease YjfF, partial [Sinorhizobium sp. 6-117]|nr:sugar ABC transporter permease YjfF [Sinorhizobium sp. 6-117]
MKQKYLPLTATILIFVLSYALCAAQYPNILSTRVIGNLLTDNAFLGIAAVGMTFVILSGGIDLSVGSIIAFTGVFLAVVLEHTSMHPLVAFALVLAITTLFGALMGVIIHYLEMPAFIVTLAGMFLARGMAFVLSIDSIPIKHPFYATLKGLYYKLPGGGRITPISAPNSVVMARTSAKATSGCM